MPIFLLFVSAGVLCDGVFSLWTPYTSTPVAIQFFNGDLKKIQRFWHGNIKKVKFSEASRFAVGELTKIFFKKMQKFHKTCCYFGQNQKRKESVSISNFYGQLPNMLFTCLCLRVRVLKIVAVT